MDKKCYTCGNIKLLTEFNKNKSKKDGLNTICKECSRERSRRYYKENLDLHKSNVSIRNQRVRKENIERVYEYLDDKKCIDCGYSKNKIALQFDHVRGEKKDSISRMVSNGYSWESIIDEIQKCEIRCANCHMIRTADQFNWYSASL